MRRWLKSPREPPSPCSLWAASAFCSGKQPGSWKTTVNERTTAPTQTHVRKRNEAGDLPYRGVANPNICHSVCHLISTEVSSVLGVAAVFLPAEVPGILAEVFQWFCSPSRKWLGSSTQFRPVSHPSRWPVRVKRGNFT